MLLLKVHGAKVVVHFTEYPTSEKCNFFRIKVLNWPTALLCPLSSTIPYLGREPYIPLPGTRQYFCVWLLFGDIQQERDNKAVDNTKAE